MRILSLLPSATEIVFALGLGDQLVGVTHECDHPAEAARLPKVTRSLIDHQESSSSEVHRHIAESLHNGSSIYALDQVLLERLDPELILTQELCDVCAVSYDEVQRAVRVLPGPRRVLSLEPTDLGGILDAVRHVGELTGTAGQAEGVVASLQQRIDRVAARTADVNARPRVFAMEWLDPPFVGGHWVPEMIRLAGGVDGLGAERRPSHTIAWADIAAYDPEVVVLMPCGYDLAETVKQQRRASFPDEWRSLSAVKSGNVYVANGSAYFNRPGPRIVDGLEILAEILHPTLFPRQHPPEAWARLDAP